MPKLTPTSERGTELGARSSELSTFQIALYLATLILGAGVFLLPLEAERIGLIPLIGMLLLILWPCIRLYQRVATLMVRRDHRSAGGGEAVARAVVEAGAGRAGAVLSLLGIAVYVCGAAIVYNCLRLPSLELLAAQLGDSMVAGITVFGASLAGLVVSRRISPRRVISRRLLTVMSVWALTTPAVALLSSVKPAAQAVGLLGFGAGCLLVSHSPAAADRGSRPCTLAAGHSSSIAGLRLQLALMLILAGAAICVVGISAHHAIHWNAIWVAGEFRPSALLGAAAVILFAHVGAGMSNIAAYAEMSSSAFRTSAVRLSLILVTAVLVAWLVPTVLVFGHNGLASLVDAKTNSALGLALYWPSASGSNARTNSISSNRRRSSARSPSPPSLGAPRSLGRSLLGLDRFIQPRYLVDAHTISVPAANRQTGNRLSDVRLTFLGTGASSGTPGAARSARRESSLLIEGPARVLIDATRHFGEQCALIPGLDGVLLTHAHRDAAGGIPALRRWRLERTPAPLPVYASPQAVAVLRDRHRRLDGLEPIAVEPGEPVHIGKLEAVAAEVPHARERRFRTYAWRLSDGTHSVVYASDVARLETGLRRLSAGADLLVIDGAMWRRPLFAHLTIDRALPKLCRWSVGRILLTQIGRTAPGHAALERQVRALCPHAAPAWDGLVVEL